MFPLLNANASDLTISQFETYTGILLNKLLDGSLFLVKKILIVLLIWFIGK